MSWFREAIIETGRLPLFLCFVAFVVTFLTTRMITRLIRSGRGPFKDNVSASGLHVHHAVPGVVLLVVGAFVAVGANGQTGWAEFGGVLVGIGTSLVLDEFALILRLDDVYWQEEGRLSVQVVGLALACLGLVLLGFNPVFVDRTDATTTAVSAGVIVIHFLLVFVIVAKGKYLTALFAVFIPPVAVYGAVRLARPRSRWARRRYGDHKLERAVQRAEAFDARYNDRAQRLADFIGGTPDG